jgi:hypothetical protein
MNNNYTVSKNNKNSCTGLDPLKDVECLSVLGSGVGIYEVGVIGGL